MYLNISATLTRCVGACMKPYNTIWQRVGCTVFAVAIATTSPSAHSENTLKAPPINESLLQQDPVQNLSRGNTHLPSGSKTYQGQVGSVDYAQNGRVGMIRVRVEQNNLPADGQTPVRLTINVLDKNQQPLVGNTVVTVQVSGGRIQLPGATTDEFGPDRKDLDPINIGTQVNVLDGQAEIMLLAPFEPQDVVIRVTAGSAEAQGVISFIPDLRDMLAVGIVEGIIRFDSKSPLALSSPRSDDGFEEQIMSFARMSDEGKRTGALRTAFFLKGTIKGDALLTMAYDSDKESYQRLFNDIRPDDYYPVYGDASIKGFDAPSISKLYVRIDKNKSYLLWGDFNTGNGFSQFTEGGKVANIRQRDLGSYSRTMNGLRGHYEKDNVLLNSFVTKDSLIEFVEEFPGQGISGPFTVSRQNAVSGSEKLEVITRDRYQPAVILQVDTLQRFGDYSFEPFSGRILLREPLPSVDMNGNPQSLRVTYEVDSGGESFWVYGADGQIKLSQNIALGGSYVHDKNPYAPYTLMSGNATWYMSDTTAVVAEVARSKSILNSTLGQSLNGNPYSVQVVNGQTLPQNGALQEVDGNAWRIEMLHQQEDTQARIYYGNSGRYFNNPSASLAQGRSEGAAKISQKLNEKWRVYGEMLHSEDTNAGAQRDAAEVGAVYSVNPKLEVDVALTHTKEQAGDFSNAPVSFGSGLVSPLNNSGINTMLINPQTGYGINGASFGLAGVSYDSTGIRLRSTYHMTDKLDLLGEYEHGIANQHYYRAAAGAAYRFSEIGRVYGKYEWVTGLASPQATDGIYDANAFVLGMDTEYLPEQRLFSEYRMRDAIAGNDLQWATGLRNAWALSETVKIATTAEYLQSYQGQTPGAYALTGAVEWRPDDIWLVGGKLEWRRAKNLTITNPNPNNDPTIPASVFLPGNDSWLSTVTIARKINRDWTFLGRNYLLYNNNHGYSGNVWEDRLQLGVAYRDTARNRLNVLARYEYWVQRDNNGIDLDSSGNLINDDEGFNKHIISLHGDYHLSRAWWIDGRLAGKWQKDYFDGGQDKYSAYLLSGRVTYDITERWDISGLGSIMYSPQGASKQYAQGIEVGCQVQTNLWLSAGYNWRGFNDRDLVGADYTNQGVYVRLRFKFDEDLLSMDKSKNK